MNILPKKRWHVRTKENIARVKEDEAKYAEEERQTTYRSLLANQEARTEALRKRLHILPTSDESMVSAAIDSSNGAILSDQSAELIIQNKEYEEEKRKDQEAKEKSIGLLTYLGQSVLDAAGKKPWYAEPRNKPNKRSSLETDERKAKLRDEWEAKKKLRDDPLTRMNQVSDWFEKRREEKIRDETRILQRAKSCISALPALFPNDIAVPQRRFLPTTSYCSSSTLEHDCSADNPRNPSKESSKPTSSTHGSEAIKLAKQLQLDRLRSERLQRERSERDRAAVLLAHSMGLPQARPSAEEAIPTDERELPFNSAFNPELSAVLAQKRQRHRESRKRPHPSD